MKKRRLPFLLMIVALVFGMMVPAYAVEGRASDQISVYSITISPGSGTIDVEFSITGKGVMTKIGCESIELYEKSGGSWVLATTLDEDDTGMSKTNTFTHRNMISVDTEADVEYKITATVFAENSAGRDTRSETEYFTG